MASEPDSKDSQVPHLIKARLEVQNFIKEPTNILPDFPATMKDLGLVGISSAELSALAITEELGKMHLAAALADTLCAMFVDSNAGISTWLEEILLSAAVREAIAARFNWLVKDLLSSEALEQPLRAGRKGFNSSKIIHYMVGRLHDSETRDDGDGDFERWTGEFFKPLAHMARKALYPTWTGVASAKQMKPYTFNEPQKGERSLPVIQMEEYLRRQRAGEEIPMVTGWLEKHKVVKRLLQGGVGDIEMEE
ncbi:hypothetical protein C8J57DRAFT_1716248 [Mycena rebaudengoi]|nr:hypothetical protein C8J57DRAFT_1716248 [Mycena rebaudengoi]